MPPEASVTALDDLTEQNAGADPHHAGGANLITVISPDRGWFDWRLRQLWRYRDLILLLVWRDFVSAYKQTVLGPSWHVIRPLLSTMIFTVVFGRVARIPTDGIPPFLFFMAGQVAWSYFNSCIENISRTFISNIHLLGRVYFHRLALPISVLLSNLIALAIQFAVFLIALVGFMVSGAAVHVTTWVLAVPIVIIALGGYALAGGIIVCALTTRYRDLSHLISFALQLVMYLSPVIYPVSFVPENYRWLLALNPLTPLFEAFRRGLLGVGTVTVGDLAVSMGFLVVFMTFALMLFTRVERTFMDTV